MKLPKRKIKPEKPTFKDYEKLREMYQEYRVITEEHLKDIMRPGQILWLKRNKYISLVKDLGRCHACRIPLQVGSTSCCVYHSKLWYRCISALSSKGKTVVSNGDEEYNLLKNCVENIKKYKGVELTLVRGRK